MAEIRLHLVFAPWSVLNSRPEYQYMTACRSPWVIEPLGSAFKPRHGQDREMAEYRFAAVSAAILEPTDPSRLRRVSQSFRCR